MTTKETLYHLIDTLPESVLPEVERFLESLAAQDDPVLRAFLQAPEDWEPLSSEDIAAIEEGKAEVARGEFSSWEEVRTRLFGDA